MLLTESSETTRNLNSAHLDIKVNGSIPNLPVHTLTGDLTNTPAVAAKGNANITLRGQTLALATRFRRPQRPHPQKLARAVAANRPALVTSDMSALRM